MRGPHPRLADISADAGAQSRSEVAGGALMELQRGADLSNTYKKYHINNI